MTSGASCMEFWPPEPSLREGNICPIPPGNETHNETPLPYGSTRTCRSNTTGASLHGPMKADWAQEEVTIWQTMLLSNSPPSQAQPAFLLAPSLPHSAHLSPPPSHTSTVQPVSWAHGHTDLAAQHFQWHPGCTLQKVCYAVRLHILVA